MLHRMSSPQTVSDAASNRISPDQGVLSALRALVDEQTRFSGTRVTSDDERSVPQSWTMTEKVRLFSQTRTDAINGYFSPQSEDIKTSSPQASAEQDLEAGLSLGMSRMRRLLEDPAHRFEDVRATTSGAYLGMRRHWYLENCAGCGGAGKKSCYQCYGRGSENCSRCLGRRRVSCGCLGGKRTCTRCSGLGTHQVSYLVTASVYDPATGRYDQRTTTEYRTESCPSCLYGQVTCSNCGGSMEVTCPTCSGSGTRQCGICHGDGSLRCSTCSATGRVGKSSRVVVAVEHVPQLAWGAESEAWSAEVATAIGLNEVVALSETISSGPPLQQGTDTFRFVRHGVLPADRATVACDGANFDAIAYGHPRRWWTGPQLVEHLLQSDVQTLEEVTANARASRRKVSLAAVLDALGAVAQSPAHTQIVAHALGQSDHVPAGVSAGYAKNVQEAVRAGTLLVHRATGLNWAFKVALMMVLVGGLSWLVLGAAGAIMMTAVIAVLGVMLRHPVMLRRLKAVYGSMDAARAAQRLAGHDRWRSWGLALVFTVGLGTLIGKTLPERGPWQPAGLRMPAMNWQALSTPATISADEPAITSVAQALDARDHGRLNAARAALEGLAAQNVPGAAGPLAWMTLQGEGQLGFAEGSPPQGMGDRSIRAWDASRLVAKAGQQDPWGEATLGMMMLAGVGGAPHNEHQGAANLLHAAGRGVTPAMVQVGRIAWRQHRPEMAKNWLTQAANAGDPQGMYDLGTLLWDLSSGRDSMTARSWWDRAERHGGVLVHEPMLGVAAIPKR
jgi:TPR repeat protein